MNNMVRFSFKLISFFIVFLLIVLQTSYFIRHEQNIYSWDYNGYWRVWENFSQLLHSNTGAAFKQLKQSVLQDDYNILPIFILSLLDIIKLPSRLLYIELINIVYFLPVLFLFKCVVDFFTEDKNKNNILWNFSTIFIPALFVAFWAPSLRGYPDISGLIFVLASVLITSRHDLTSKINIPSAIMLGLSLWGAFLFRRWYAFTVVSLYCSLPILNYYLHSNSSLKLKKILITAFNFFISGFTSCIAVIFLQHELFERILHTDYSEIYGAYQAPFATSVRMVFYNIGIYLFPLILIGLVGSFHSKNKKSRPIVLFSAFNLILSFLLFTRTQAPGVQHCLPFSLWAVIIIVFGIKFILDFIKNKTLKIATLSLILVIHATIFAISLNRNQLETFAGSSYLLPTKVLPLKIDNFSNYVDLVQDIEGLTKNGEHITVFSSNGVLNDDMLNTISNLGLSGKISYASQVDLRDQIHVDSLMSSYFIVTSPAQTHLVPSGQQVITIPVNQIIKHESIGKTMIKLDKEYILSGGVTAYIYKKVRNYTPAEVDDFYQLFFESYPAWDGQINKGFPYILLSSDITVGDIWGGFGITYDGKIEAHPGEHTPTFVKWNLRGVNKLTIHSVNTNCVNADGVDINISAPNKISKFIHIDNGKSNVIDVKEFNNLDSQLSISKHFNSACDAVEISGE
ncbi:hypothetical protein [Pantoea sp. SO10]|uniref:hypothetical protein n=1 Tax=Pantoea sp. SO10 TaxID=2575375 RepID=UPI0010C94139|nr:hypothetical protein [Pantoea sp. SO10]QCP60134.1 hypothetical protein FCN45_12405 [Pantoea sp. SO10]